MSTSSKTTAEAVQQPPAEKPLYAVFFQLEDIAVNGRKAAFEALKKIFSRAKKDLTPALFTRYCLSFSPSVYLPQLAEVLHITTPSPEKMLEEFNEEMTAALAELSPDPAFVKILNAARARKFALIAVTALPETLATSICGRLGLDEIGVHLLPFQNGDRLFPGPITWIKTARSIELRPRCCLAFAASMSVCKSALSADMQCVVVPDEFTECQDFSGANMILENFSEFRPDELLAIVFPPEGH